MNLAEGLAQEIKRNIELVDLYKSIGPHGMPGAMMIKRDVDEAISIQASGDVLEMCRIYEVLKANKE